jgi:hypothetical protein
MVNDEVIRAIHYLTMHSSRLSTRVKCFDAEHGEPLKLRQPVIVLCIDEGEFAFGKRYPPGGLGIGFEGFARLEISATAVKGQGPPFAHKVGFLLAYEYRPADADCIGRKRAIIATDFSFYISHRFHRLHRFIKS